MAHEAMAAELTELDSDGSSGAERDARKRARGDADSAGPKKRRKQTTPVRFSSSLTTGAADESNEDEDEDAGSEGKPTSRSPLSMQPAASDENPHGEFRCDYCGQSYGDRESLDLHLDAEHGASVRVAQQHHAAGVKPEPSRTPDQSDGSVNLLSVKNFASTWLAAGQHVQSQTQIQSQIQSQIAPQGEDSWPGPVGQLGSMTNHLQALSGFPGALAQYLPLHGFPLADASHMPRPALGPAPVRIFNPDAYCDLCNKEFCNKYFLKTHKANKHGIYVDSPGPGAAESGVPPPAFAPSGFAGGPVKLEPPATPPTPSVACDVCQKRFKNEESARKHRQKVHGESADQTELPAAASRDDEDRETSRGSPGGIEALFKQEYGVEQEDTTFMPAPRHLSPQSIQQARDSGFNADRLRRLGVINPEAFCEICCKEYCNKYFLRTHKLKRHGVVVQDSEKSPSNPASAASWHQVQTSPLNLIVSDSVGNSSESNDRTVDDYECKPCGLRFQTAGLHQAHCRKMHDGEEQRSPKREIDAEQGEQRADTISEDLQKLQTMILQLNGLEAAAKGSVCGACGKECDSGSALRVHMASEHGAVAEDPSSPQQEKSPTGAYCTLCDKDYPGQDALRKHITDEHQPAVERSHASGLPHAPSAPTTSAGAVNAPGQPPPEKKIASVTPTSSYCEICNKELCNKYFMKTHMQRMHGIEIENGAQIGGVICNICNKELCSKYFLRVHKHNTHGIVDENTPASVKQESYEAATTDDSALKPEQLGDLSHRYFTHFTEVCPICSRRFRSVKWLKAHLLGDHGKSGVDKWREMEQQYQAGSRAAGRSVGSSKGAQQPGPNLKIPNGFEAAQQAKSGDYAGLGNQVLSNLFGAPAEDHQAKTYRCSYCSFTTTVLPFLFLHERSHVSPQESVEGEKSFQCPICSQGFQQPELLHQHLLGRHQFPALLSQFQPPVLAGANVDADRSRECKDRLDQEAKDDRSAVSPRTSGFGQNAPQQAKPARDETAVQVTPQGAYKCAQCGYATANLNRIKKHVRKDHKSIGDPTDSVIAELSKTLKEVANKHKMPACYAMPQDMNSNPEKTIMQPFVIEEQDVATAGEESCSEKRFVPALVYLPVKSRIGGALTASFTLSPA